MLASDRFDVAWELADDELVEIDLGAGVVDIYTDQIALSVVVEKHAFGNLLRVGAHLLRQVVTTMS